MLRMLTRVDSYELQTFYGRVAYLGFLLNGGIYTEASVNRLLRGLVIFLSSYTVTVMVGGTILYSLLHRHDELTMAERLFTLINPGGVLCNFAIQLIITIYRDPMKASIKFMDECFYSKYMTRGEMKNSLNAAVNVPQIFYLVIYAFAVGFGFFLALRPIGLAILGSENMSNIFFQYGYLPLGFVEKRYGLAMAYWLAFCLIAPALVYALLWALFGILIVSVIPGTIYNNFWLLQCRIVEDSRRSEQNFVKYESNRNEAYTLEASRVVQRYVHYLQRYQKLIRELNVVREYTEVFYSLLYAAPFILSLPGGILITTTTEDFPVYAITSLVSMLSATIVYLIMFAHIGTHLDEVNTGIMTSLYDSPWMWLQPKQRQILITFMIMLQRPITLRIFKIRPVTLVLLLRFCQLNYTIINFFRMKAST